MNFLRLAFREFKNYLMAHGGGQTLIRSCTYLCMSQLFNKDAMVSEPITRLIPDYISEEFP